MNRSPHPLQVLVTCLFGSVLKPERFNGATLRLLFEQLQGQPKVALPPNASRKSGNAIPIHRERNLSRNRLQDGYCSFDFVQLDVTDEPIQLEVFRRDFGAVLINTRVKGVGMPVMFLRYWIKLLVFVSNQVPHKPPDFISYTSLCFHLPQRWHTRRCSTFWS